MKQAMALALLTISLMVGSLAAEASTANAVVSAPTLSQVTAPLCSAASPLQVPETLPGPLNASSCRDSMTIINYWGFEGVTGVDSCPVRCGVCLCEQMTNKLVGQVIYECDGSITTWGLSCSELCGSPTITNEPCPICSPEVY